MIVTLAGHVDHGKTSLVRALTGVDTDRLEQEKQRGLTIDLGFAYIDNGNIGFVDVPGHHKFIHNMVAGVASQQFAMLVIAADDGPMPQSREHLEILTLVGIKRGCVVMTKCDRIPAERAETCQQDIRTLVSGSFLEHAPIFATSTQDDTSFVALLGHLRDQAAAYDSVAEHQPFRMAIDRTFSIKGAGVVVTGTVHSGQIDVDQSLRHFPSNKAVRVRGIRAQDQEVQRGISGQRCALNIAGIDLDQIKRGDWLTELAQAPCIEASVNLTVTQSFPRPVKHWTPVHIYHATSHTTGRIALLDNHRIAPGGNAVVDIVADQPLALAHGETVVLRDQSLDVTLGGGDVLTAQTSATHRRRAQERVSRIRASDVASAEAAFNNWLRLTGIVDLEEFAVTWPLPEEQQSQLVADHHLVGRSVVSQERWSSLKQQALQQIKDHHAQDSSSPGLRANAFSLVRGDVMTAVLNELVQEKAIAHTGGIYSQINQRVELPPELQRAWEALKPSLDQLQAPSTGDLAKSLRIPQAKLEVLLKDLTKRGLVVHVANHRYYLPTQLTEIANRVVELVNNKPMTVREFRDSTGIGRNVAIEVLEYFDRRGFTRRNDNERVVTRDSL